MDDWFEHDHRMRALAVRVAALEDNVSFLEEWCEEQQDVLDRSAGPQAYDYERPPLPLPRVVLRVVDLRDEVLSADDAGGAGDDAAAAGDGHEEAPSLVVVAESEHDRKVRQIRVRLDRLRTTLAASGL